MLLWHSKDVMNFLSDAIFYKTSLIIARTWPFDRKCQRKYARSTRGAGKSLRQG